MEKVRNIIFITTFSLVLCLGFGSLFTSQKKVSKSENRDLYQFKHPTIGHFLKGTYQSNLEHAIEDQILLSGTIKQNMNKYLSFSNNFLHTGFLCKNNYLKLGETDTNTYYNFNCDKRMVYGYITSNEINEKKLTNIIDSYSKLNELVDTYYYYVPTSETINFRDGSTTWDIYSELTKNLKGNYKIDKLKYNGYDEYKELFYATDHHWNNRGSYKGYLDMVKLLKAEGKVNKPVDEITLNLYFNGSMARALRKYDFKEKLRVYKFTEDNKPLLKMQNGYEYGQQEKYFNNKYETGLIDNHYARFYGPDLPELKFNTKRPDLDNLLIISNSFSNAVNVLLATHFNKTYVLDLRLYKKFNPKEYIEKNDIDKVLVLMDDSFVTCGEFIIDWGNK